PLSETIRCVPSCSKRVRWSVCSSPSAKQPFWRRSMLLFAQRERRATRQDPRRRSSSREPNDKAIVLSDSQLRPIVFIVDDDVSVRESLELLIQDAGWQPETFASATSFLRRARPQVPSCLLLDVSLPDLNGLDLQQRIADDRADMPIIFITGYGDVPMT